MKRNSRINKVANHPKYGRILCVGYINFSDWSFKELDKNTNEVIHTNERYDMLRWHKYRG